MKAMVLAAGFGERMKPLTWNRAKPALPLLNRPSILHILEHLAANGVDQAAINLHYRPDSIRALEPLIREMGIRPCFLEEPSILGTGGGLRNARSLLEGGTLVMVNSDFVTDCPILLALDVHRQSQAMATLVLTPYQEGTEYGAVEMEENGAIVRIAGHPGAETRAKRFHFTGIHIIESALFNEIPGPGKIEINREIYPKLIERGVRISGYVCDSFWRELGTPQRYLEGSLDLLLRGDLRYLQKIRVREGVYSATAFAKHQGTVEPCFLAGRDLRMESGTFAAGVSLGDRVTLLSGSSLTRSILWDDVRLEKGASLHECIVASSVTIPSGSRLSRKTVISADGYAGDSRGLEASGRLLMASF